MAESATCDLHIIRKQNDLANDIDLILVDGDTPVPLSAASQVRFIVGDGEGGQRIAADMEIAEDQTEGSDTCGFIKYVLETAATSKPGTWKAEVEVLWNNGRRQTFPENDYITLTILPDLG